MENINTANSIIEQARFIASSEEEGLERDKALQSLYNSAANCGADEIVLAYISDHTGWGRRTCEAHRALAAYADGELDELPTGLPWHSMRSAYVEKVQRLLEAEYDRLFEPVLAAHEAARSASQWIAVGADTRVCIKDHVYHPWYVAFHTRQWCVYMASIELGKVIPCLKDREEEEEEEEEEASRRCAL